MLFDGTLPRCANRWVCKVLCIGVVASLRIPVNTAPPVPVQTRHLLHLYVRHRYEGLKSSGLATIGNNGVSA
jgi:hypothetical protein